MSDSKEKEAFFNALYEKYKKLVYKTIFSYSKDLDFCEDCFQDTFLKVWNKLKLFTQIDENHKKNLVCTIARGIVFDKLRKQNNENKNTNILYFNNDIDDNASILLINTASSEDIKIAMKTCLSKREQDILILKFYHGLSNKEISDIYNIKAAWTSELIHKALDKLKLQLGDEYNFE